jgi:NAD/NADP transhydrogenase beta subunit
MAANDEEMDLNDRLKMIETMIAEGRRTTETWGWLFVLWGVAYYVAIGWSHLSNFRLIWPITMVGTGVLTTIICTRMRQRTPRTTVGRAIGVIWIAAGLGMFIVLDSLGYSGRMDMHVFVAVMSAMLGTANAASGLLLKWKPQIACALVWWSTTVIACFSRGMGEKLRIVLLLAIFLCQIVFGAYMMIREARQRKQGASHA